MAAINVLVKKSTGDKAPFSIEKLRTSLYRSGARKEDVQHILDVVQDELYQGISTKEIYHRALGLLKRKKSVFASKYKLKKAIYELGPSGFPFERFIGQVLYYSGYEIQIGAHVQGHCVSHEIDVVATRNKETLYVECKFHGEEGRNCDVKVPLYIHSRYRDILANLKGDISNMLGWVVTNTRFSADAVTYGNCAGLQLLSWDYPKGNGLKDRIDKLGLYPITVSTLLTEQEKSFLLGRDVVLCKQLLNDRFYLDHLGISEIRKAKIINEIKLLCDESN